MMDANSFVAGVLFGAGGLILAIWCIVQFENFVKRKQDEAVNRYLIAQKEQASDHDRP